MRSTYHRLEPCLPILAALALQFAPVGEARASDGSSPRAAAAASTRTLVISGAGYGHGVGMSQEGALGYAEHGWPYQQILAHYYTGTSIGQAPPASVVRVLIGSKVHRIALETYVRGVISAEVSASWPLAALEAQAVASRTYALTAHAGGSRFDVYADTRSQVFRGVAAETPQTDAAVAATAGQVVTYGGRPVVTYFFASSGGMTENVENAFPGAEPEPWLLAVPDPYDGGPLHRWKLSVSFQTVAARLKGLFSGALRGIEVIRRGVSPRIISAEVLGTRGSTSVGGPELAARLGLYDTWAYFSVRSGQNVKPEPDQSGKQESLATPLVPTATGPQGGASAPGGTQSTPAGGVAAG